MNKKFIVFILILSLIIPFFPSMHFTVFAEDSVSENDPNPFQNEVMRYFADRLIRDGYVVRDFDDLVAGYLQAFGYISQGTDQLENQIHEFNQNVSNGFFTTDDVIHDVNIQNSIDNYILNNQVYFIYHSMPVSQFFTYFVFNPSGDSNTFQSFKNWLIGHVNNNVDSLCGFFSQSYLGDAYNRLVDYSSLIDDYSLCLYDNGSFDNYPFYEYQTYIHSAATTSEPYPFSLLKFYANLDGFSYSGYFPTWTIDTTLLQNSDSFSHVGFVSNPFYPSNGYNFYGTLYLSPDSVGSISFPVFRSATDLQLFYKGQANVYKFDNNVNIPDGADIDYSRLFEQISHGISENTGNVIDAINNAANNYLSQQIELLGDINNALNDETGRSWLRRIYNLLDIQFPQVIDAIEEIQITGGNADLTQTNTILSQINEKLGILIDEPFADMDPDDFEDLRDMAGRKFPFCIFSDIVAISVILNQRPIVPDINIPLPLGSASVNTVYIDLSPYEYVRPYVHGCIIFLFIIGLLALSVKVFGSVKS